MIERGAGVRVENGGVPGYGSRQMLGHLRRLLPAIHPRVVVMTLCPLWDRQRCATLTRRFETSERDVLTRVTAEAVRNTPLTTAVGFLSTLKDYDQYRTLRSIATTTRSCRHRGTAATCPTIPWQSPA